MGYFKKKIILTLLGILILIALFSCVSYFTFALSFGKKEQQTNAADLTISTLDELQTFANNVNKGVYGTSYVNIKLGTNIDCGGATIAIGTKASPFVGEFDGGYHTISNFRIAYLQDYDPTSDFNTDVGGLFRVATWSTIKNLRVYNFSDDGNDPKFNLSNVGGLIGAATRQCYIYDCIVDTFSCTSSLLGTASGLIASGSVYVERCLVTNVTSNVDFYAFGPGAWSNNSTGYTYLEEAIYCGNATSIDTFYNYDTSADHQIISCYTSKTGDNFAALSSIGDSTAYTWYYKSNFNNGFPYLSGFLQNTNFYFDCDGDGEYETTRSINGDQVSAAINLMGEVVKYRDNKIIYFQYIGSENVYPAELEGLSFDGWEKVDDTHYKAKFSLKTYAVRFNICDNATVKVDNVVIVEYVSYNINDNTEISVALTPLSQSGTYSKIVFTFDGVTVEYEVNASYYSKGYNKDGGISTSNSFTITEATVISLNTFLKTFAPSYE